MSVVICRYNYCSNSYCIASHQLVTSTKTGPQRDYIELVVGIGQMIKGIDRALQLMSTGERATVTISAEYAYGAAGFPPLIPPHSDLVFDLTLVSHRPRPLWRKPLIQSPGLSQKPYVQVGDSGGGGNELDSSIPEEV
jgi:hypothetical protein